MDDLATLQMTLDTCSATLRRAEADYGKSKTKARAARYVAARDAWEAALAAFVAYQDDVARGAARAAAREAREARAMVRADRRAAQFTLPL